MGHLGRVPENPPYHPPAVMTYLVVCSLLGRYVQAENLALHKPVSQLGTFEGNTADLATDGNTNQDLRQGSCAHPYGIDPSLIPYQRSDTSAWWVVDLTNGQYEVTFTVTAVVIYNRLDCCTDRLVGASIRVSADTIDVRDHVVCANIRAPASVIQVPCVVGFPVRFLSVVHPSRPDFALCEVQVEGHQYMPVTPSQPPSVNNPLPNTPVPSSLPPPTPSPQSSTSLPWSTIGEIAVGCVCAVLVVLVVVAACLYWRARRRKGSEADQPQNIEAVLPGSDSMAMTDRCRSSQRARIRGQTSIPDSPLLGSDRNADITPAQEQRSAALFAENQAGFQKLSKLLEKKAVSLPLDRQDMVEKLLKIYWEHPHILKHHLKVKYSGERGVDWGGLTRDLFSTFWDQITSPGPHAYFKGNDAVVPSLPLHRMRKESWKFIAIGRILAHTATLAKFIPQKLSRASYLAIIFGSSVSQKHNILKDFLKFLEEEDRRLVKKAILTYDTLTSEENEALVDFYSRNGLQVLPKAGGVKDQVVSIAEQQLLRGPRELHELVREGIPEAHLKAFWSHLSLDHLTTQLRKQLPTGQDITDWIITPSDVTPAQTKVLMFLREYLLELDRPGLVKFLAFVTGSRHFPHEPIAVTFNELSGLQRRPISQTCANNLQLSVHYSSLDDLRTEMNQYLSSQYSYDFSMC